MCQKPQFVDGQVRTCNKCHECRLHNSNEWYVRLYHEMVTHASHEHAFVTLTYDNVNLPEDGNGVKQDLVDFVKRLRDRLNYPEDLKYFGASEYGKENGRIHYHLILLNLSREICDFSVPKIRKNFRKLVRDTWNMGRTESSRLHDRRIRYVVDYISSSDKLMSEKFGHAKEFRIMSNFIGFDWIDNPDNQKFVQENNFVIINGYKYSVPSYYKRKLRERMDVYEEEEAKIDSRIVFLSFLHNHNYFAESVDFDEYKRLILERKDLELFCRDKELETAIKKAKRRRHYYFYKVYDPELVKSDSEALSVSMMKACEFLDRGKYLKKFYAVNAELLDLICMYDRHKSRYREIWLSEHGDPTQEFAVLDRKIEAINEIINKGIEKYVDDMRSSAPQRLRNFEQKQLLKLSRSKANPEINYYYRYVNYEI